MQKLRAGELSSLRLRPTSTRIIEKLVAKGWIERGSEARTYRISQAGETAMREQLPVSRPFQSG